MKIKRLLLKMGGFCLQMSLCRLVRNRGCAIGRRQEDRTAKGVGGLAVGGGEGGSHGVGPTRNKMDDRSYLKESLFFLLFVCFFSFFTALNTIC